MCYNQPVESNTLFCTLSCLPRHVSLFKSVLTIAASITLYKLVVLRDASVGKVYRFNLSRVELTVSP
jgi:hypothetical protein